MNTQQYFYRNVLFSKQGKEISIVDPESPETNRQTLEPWFGLILQLADGQHTIDELYNFLAQNYQQGAPENLLRTVTSVIERMSDAHLIVLTDLKTELPYYLSLPYELMDWEKAKQHLKEDKIKYN